MKNPKTSLKCRFYVHHAPRDSTTVSRVEATKARCFPVFATFAVEDSTSSSVGKSLRWYELCHQYIIIVMAICSPPRNNHWWLGELTSLGSCGAHSMEVAESYVGEDVDVCVLILVVPDFGAVDSKVRVELDGARGRMLGGTIACGVASGTLFDL